MNLQARNVAWSVVICLPLVAGCYSVPASTTIKAWRVAVPTDEYSLAPRLCSLRGKRIAVVPGRSFQLDCDSDVVALTSTDAASSRATAIKAKELTTTVDGENSCRRYCVDVPEADYLARWEGVVESMGFEVVDRSHDEVVSTPV